jgi:hypothetical protein
MMAPRELGQRETGKSGTEEGLALSKAHLRVGLNREDINGDKSYGDLDDANPELRPRHNSRLSSVGASLSGARG